MTVNVHVFRALRRLPRQEGKVFEGQTLAEMETDFDGVRAAYAKLFNVLALKFSQHGSWARTAKGTCFFSRGGDMIVRIICVV